MIMASTYVDVNGDEVAYGTAGAMTLIEYVTNKNWTINWRAA